MDTLSRIIETYNLTLPRRMPCEIPNAGREQLAQLFGKLGYTRGAEIGTEKGVFAKTLLDNIPGLKLYCVDKFTVYPGYRDHQDQEELSYCFIEAHSRLFGCNVEFIREFSMDALSHFEDNSLDFVYIDANHEWPYITQDIYYWSKKVKPGGIVAGHDYYRSGVKDSRCHVKAAVEGYAIAYRLKPWFILGRWERLPGEIRDTSRSWFWVKA